MDDNRYLLAMLVAKRAKQISLGAKPMVKSKSKKPIVIALEEIKQGKVSYRTISKAKEQQSGEIAEIKTAEELFKEDVHN